MAGSNYNRWAIPDAGPATTANNWETYFEQLPDWEDELLCRVELLVPQEELFQRLVENGAMVGSDGSVQGPKASFAWVLSDNDGNRLANCNGPVFGSKPTSYRAEAYGILSVCRFFYHLKTKWQVSCKFALYCDNKTSVNRSAERNDVLKATPNSTLESEWDVLAEIWVTLQELTMENSIKMINTLMKN